MTGHDDTFLHEIAAGDACPLSARELAQHGARYGIDYHFPALPPRRVPGPEIVLRGRVREFTLGPGMQLVASDIKVLQRYDSRSRAPTPLSIIVMLEGGAEIALSDRRLSLKAGQALSVQLAPAPGIQAVQLPGQRLRALTLSLDERRLTQLGVAVTAPIASRMRAWPLPEALRQSLEQALGAVASPAQRLLLEGTCLQLLAHGLPDGSPLSPVPPLPGDEARLARVRHLLETFPEREHRLADLAHLAAMSPATLRRKFHARHGLSVFAYLRECRLRRGRACLEQGHSVQQAAQLCGYRHASNFTLAFRRRYGHSPSGWRQRLERRA